LKRLIPFAVLASLAVVACGSSSKSSSTPPSTAVTPTTASATALNIGNPTTPVSLNEDGSSLLYPFLLELVGPLHTAYPNITLATAAGGSGKGISDAEVGNVQMGGSDAYLSPGDMTKYPGLENVPIAISSQAINYNLPGVTNLKLSGNVIAQIYQGTITSWNAPAIAALNPGVTLPAMKIVPVRRVDSSGDTFIFTSFLSATNTTWASGPSFDTTVPWPPVSNELSADGNPGMVQTCHTTPGCIAYVGISEESAALAAGLGEAELQNEAMNFVLPSATTIESAVAAGVGSVPANLAAPLIYEPGAQSYPIVNFEYLVVKETQSSAAVAQAIRTFLVWASSPTGGSTPTFLAAKDFEALPTSVVAKADAVIAKITG